MTDQIHVKIFTAGPTNGPTNWGIDLHGTRNQKNVKFSSWNRLETQKVGMLGTDHDQ